MLAVVAAALFASPKPTVQPTASVQWAGAPAARIVLQSRSLGVTPDGVARILVRVLFRDALGKPTTLLGGGDVEFSASAGELQWQTRSRFDAPSAVLSVRAAAPVTIDVATNAELGSLQTRTSVMPATVPTGAVVGAPLGPHLVQLGWFAPANSRTTIIVRSGPDGANIVGLVGAPASTYRDTTVVPGGHYAYTVITERGRRTTLSVDVPPEFDVPAGAIAGKGMWLSFSPSARDPDAYTKLDPQAVVAQALAAGLRYIELRTAYGEYWEVTPQAQSTIDALIDLAAQAGISVIGWTVPRTTSYDDLALATRTAAYTTPQGNHFAGIAVDLERGDEFLGSGASGYAALTDYLRLVRAALGPRYPIMATVEDPSLEHLDASAYPYHAIAAAATAFQPMIYWRMLSKQATSPASVRAIIAASFAAARHAAGRSIDVNVG
ncbi:MAG TPA: hypothetical protein VGD50_03575, partial [Candidatus Baltobacteraceae bacterium]